MLNLDTAFIKQHSSSIIKPLTHLINLSITSGQFPDQLKKAVVTPIFKAGDTDQTCNYRPISILPALSKVLEKVVTEQLVDHLESNFYILSSLPLDINTRQKQQPVFC